MRPVGWQQVVGGGIRSNHFNRIGSQKLQQAGMRRKSGFPRAHTWLSCPESKSTSGAHAVAGVIGGVGSRVVTILHESDNAENLSAGVEVQANRAVGGLSRSTSIIWLVVELADELAW